MTIGFIRGVEDHATRYGELASADARYGPIDVAVIEPVAEPSGSGRRGPPAHEPNGRRSDRGHPGQRHLPPDDPSDRFWSDDPRLTEWPRRERAVPDVRAAACRAEVLRLARWRRPDDLARLARDRPGRASTSSRRSDWSSSRRQSRMLPDVAATQTGLPAIVAEADRSLLVSRTGVFVLMLQLVVLAGYAIVLTADLIVDHRRLDTALLRSRGASPLQVGVLALAEALLAVAGEPARAVAGGRSPSACSTRGSPGRGRPDDRPLRPDGVPLRRAPPAWCAAARPAGLPRGTVSSPRSAVGRAGDAPARPAPRARHRAARPSPRSGCGSSGCTALRSRERSRGSSASTRSSSPRPPSACSRAAWSRCRDRAAPRARRRARRVPRSPPGRIARGAPARAPALRYTRAALLLMLAMSMGVFAVSYTTTWTPSQGDQADFQVGRDIRITPPAASAASRRGRWPRASPGRVDDGVTPRPRARACASTPASDGGASSASTQIHHPVVSLRSDQSGDGVGTIAAGLAEARRRAGSPVERAQGPALLGEPRSRWTRLVGSCVIRRPTSWSRPRSGRRSWTGRRSSRSLPSATGAASSTGSSARPGHVGRPNRIVVPLSPSTDRARLATETAGGDLTLPIDLIGVELVVRLPANTVATAGRIAVDGLDASDASDGDTWRPVPPTQRAGGASGGPREPGWRSTRSRMPSSTAATCARQWGDGPAPPLDRLPGPDRQGNGVTTSVYTVSDVVDLQPGLIPVFVNRPFLEASGSVVGDTVLVPIAGRPRSLRIVGAVEAFPTTDPGGRPPSSTSPAWRSSGSLPGQTQSERPNGGWTSTTRPSRMSKRARSAGRSPARRRACRDAGPAQLGPTRAGHDRCPVPRLRRRRALRGHRPRR